MTQPLLDFTGAIDRVIEALNSRGRRAVALSMPLRRREQLAAVLAQRHLDMAGGYRGLPIRQALDLQSTVAIIDDKGQAHLI